MSIITIVLNGESRPVAAGCTLADLLRELSLDASGVAVERNRELVLSDAFSHTVLSDQDSIEIVQFMGGG